MLDQTDTASQVSVQKVDLHLLLILTGTWHWRKEMLDDTYSSEGESKYSFNESHNIATALFSSSHADPEMVIALNI